MLLGALFAPGLPLDGWLAAMSAQADGLGFLEFLLNLAFCLSLTSGRWYLARSYSRRACLVASSVTRGLGVALGFFGSLGRGVFAARFFLVGLVRFLCSIWNECWAIYLFTRPIPS